MSDSIEESEESPSECCRSLPDGQPSLKQKLPDLIDDSCSLRHQLTANSVERLQIKLFSRLQWDESHCRPLNGLGDRLSVAEVILVALEVRLHILCRQEPYFMA